MTGTAKEVSGGKTYIVEEKWNPSTDYFVLPELGKGEGEVVRANFSQCPTPDELDGATVVFVRYVPKAWARLVESVRPRLKSLIIFLDDDLLDVKASAGLSWSYRLKLLRLTAFRKRWLREQGVELWVSTPFLVEKYREWGPRLILPTPISETPSLTRRFFYHGTASHLAEIHWLRPIVEAVVRNDEKFSFEIIGDHEINRLYRDIPRVTVTHPMSWTSYQEFLAIPGRHIGLAPLLDQPFNRGRTYTRFFDITRCGAVGVYPQDGIYTEVVTDGVEGRLVEQRPEAWVEAILEIGEDESRRQKMLSNAQTRIARLVARSRQLEC